jgi:hypothetical protein
MPFAPKLPQPQLEIGAGIAGVDRARACLAASDTDVSVTREEIALGAAVECGANGIDAALYSGPKDYFFSGNRYIRVTRGNTGPGTVDPGYRISQIDGARPGLTTSYSYISIT